MRTAGLTSKLDFLYCSRIRSVAGERMVLGDESMASTAASHIAMCRWRSFVSAVFAIAGSDLSDQTKALCSTH